MRTELKIYSPAELFAYKLARLLHIRKTFHELYGLTRLPLEAIKKYRNLHRGQRCFIMGGGPSLKEIDPTPLQREFTFGVNGSFLIFDWLGFQPTYYVVEDTLVYEDRWQDIKARVIDSDCFFPVQFANPEFDRPNHHYFRAIYELDEAAGFPRFSRNPSRVVWIGGTVTYVCMQLAYYMGFKEIYLVGMDHNYERPAHVESEGDVWQSHGTDPNHFHPDYFGAGYRWHDPKVWRMEIAYKKAKQVFENDGRRIFNATAGGKLEVFQRVNYSDLF